MPVLRPVTAVLALSVFSAAGWGKDDCRRFVPSAGVTIAVPCEAEAADTAEPPVSADTMSRREGFELLGDSYRVLQPSDLAACERACLGEQKCVAVEFYREKRACGLFDSVPALKRAKLIDAALRQRAKTAAPPVPRAGHEQPKWCAQQPSFNDAEMLVCGEADLSALDLELERVFGAAAARATNKAERAKLDAAEDRWAELRDQCKANRVCVKAAYELRIEQLRAP